MAHKMTHNMWKPGFNVSDQMVQNITVLVPGTLLDLFNSF